MEVAREWKDYEILDMANGEKLERWGDIILARPDPQIIWNSPSFPEKWKKPMQDIKEVILVVEHGVIKKDSRKLESTLQRLKLSN